MADPIKFPGEFFTPEDRERDRWVSVAFLAAVMPQYTDIETRQMFIKECLRTKFADVPDRAAGVGPTPAQAVKMLLETLADNFDTKRLASEMASKAMFDGVLKGGETQ